MKYSNTIEKGCSTMDLFKLYKISMFSRERHDERYYIRLCIKGNKWMFVKDCLWNQEWHQTKWQCFLEYTKLPSCNALHYLCTLKGSWTGSFSHEVVIIRRKACFGSRERLCKRRERLEMNTEAALDKDNSEVPQSCTGGQRKIS